MGATKKIRLGSGYLYCYEYTEGMSIPEDSVIEKAQNQLGYISGGATLEYTPTFYTAKDDMEIVERTVIISEEVKLKTGLITWNLLTLENLINTGHCVSGAKKITLKIGGIANYSDKAYVIRFHQPDEIAGDLRVTIVGSNQGGLTLTYAKDKETTVDAEFTARSLDNTGVKLILTEDVIDEDEENEV